MWSASPGKVDGGGLESMMRTVKSPPDREVTLESKVSSSDLSIADTVDEVDFLMLECKRIGAPDFGDMLRIAYNEVAGDQADLTNT